MFDLSPLSCLNSTHFTDDPICKDMCIRTLDYLFATPDDFEVLQLLF